MRHRHSFSAARAILLGLLFGSSGLADFYVSPNGSDGGSGTIASPFVTLEKARDAVRAAKQSGPATSGTVTVWLRGGDYLRTNALALSAIDSGSEDAPVVWRAYGDERARQVLERSECMPPEQLMKLHGALRGLRPCSGSKEVPE